MAPGDGSHVDSIRCSIYVECSIERWAEAALAEKEYRAYYRQCSSVWWGKGLLTILFPFGRLWPRRTTKSDTLQVRLIDHTPHRKGTSRPLSPGQRRCTGEAKVIS
ncbi:hypothetical protein GW17_00055381 [Ensete ventricosum]|nr:hypothetical protein GW17_00055381 [Ensete ventricosum]